MLFIEDRDWTPSPTAPHNSTSILKPGEALTCSKDHFPMIKWRLCYYGGRGIISRQPSRAPADNNWGPHDAVERGIHSDPRGSMADIQMCSITMLSHRRLELLQGAKP